MTFILAFLLALAPAVPPPLVVYASLSRGDVRQGETFTTTLSVYSTSPAPLSLELNAPVPRGMTLLSTDWSTDTIWLDHSITINLRYSVQQPNDGHYETLAYTVKDGAGNVAARWTRVRVGTIVWPDARGLRRVWLPLVRR